jgi:hypothetical protein
LALPAIASAGCVDQLYGQAYKGKITGNFSRACLLAAIAAESPDDKTYSNVDVLFRQALSRQAFLSRYHAKNKGQVVPHQTSQGSAIGPAKSSGGGGGGGGGPAAPAEAAGGHSSSSGKPLESTVITPPKNSADGPISRYLASTSPAQADEIPTPIIILGGVSLLFVLGGIASYLVRRRLASRGVSRGGF